MTILFRHNLSVSALAVFMLLSLAGCQTPGTDAVTPDSDSDQPALPLRALGQEPGWILQMDDEQLQLDYQYGQHQFSAPTPEASMEGDIIRYNARADGETLFVEIKPGYCEDIMSGRPFPYTVEITINGELLRGCGGDTQSLLVDRLWAVEDINGRALVDDTPLTLSFDTDHRVSGSAGCNRFNGRYEITGEGVSFGPLALTRRACEAALMQQESDMMKVLEGASNFRLDNSGALIIRGYRGQSLRATTQN
ncbi:META domain-containing protein [Marinimicrobium alkaliphilum]|uniref:META domain-containing protein n=1 Tax=Marinimicrobium alkaliphilum TaxID=2202654 RepID=UPI000DBA7F34|nr:META domain-containing protein [Marinimicrobium alkaliphilum]